MPRKEEDRSPKGLGYGQEQEQQAAAYAASSKPAQVPIQFPGEVPEEDPGDETVAAPEMDPGLEIEGLGNLGELLFAETERPWEDPSTRPSRDAYRPGDAGPQGPPAEYQRVMRDPRVSDSTRALVAFVSRIRMLQPRR